MAMRTNPVLLIIVLTTLACALGDPNGGGSSGTSSRAPDPYPRSAPSARSPQEASGERTFYPARGVVCDRATQICYQDSRVSVSQTQAYFGDSAARRLQDKSKEARPEPKWVFEPDAETSCDMRTQVCYGSRGPNVKKTRQYFGDTAAARLEQSSGGTSPGTGAVTREKHGVGCDQSVQICYDEHGPNVKQTRKYFGDAAAEKLKKQLKR
jgi:hypothetical protein